MTSERIAKIVSMAFPVAIIASFLGFFLHISKIGDQVMLVLPIPIVIFCGLSLRKQRDREATAFLAAFTIYVVLGWIGQIVYYFHNGSPSNTPIWADGIWLLGYLVLISAFGYQIFRFRLATGQTRILRPFALIPLLVVAAAGFAFGYAWHGLGDVPSPVGVRLTTLLYLAVDMTLAVEVLSLIPLHGDTAVRLHWVPLFSGVLSVCAADVFYVLSKVEANLLDVLSKTQADFPQERTAVTMLAFGSASDILYITGYLLYTVALIYAWSFESGGAERPAEESDIGSLKSTLTLGAMHASIFLFVLIAFEKICEELVKHWADYFIPLQNSMVQSAVSFVSALVFTILFRSTIGTRLENREKQFHDYMDGFRTWLRNEAHPEVDLVKLRQRYGIDDPTAERLEKAVLFEQQRIRLRELDELKVRAQITEQWNAARRRAVEEFRSADEEIKTLRKQLAASQG